MSLEQNKAIVRDYLDEIVNKANMAAFDSYLSDDVVFNGSRSFRQQYPARLQSIRRAFPDHHLTIEDQIAEGDKVVTRVTFHGTHQGQFNGIAPTGKQVKWSGIAMDRIAGGRSSKCGTCRIRPDCCSRSRPKITIINSAYPAAMA
jgi:steroid delta-isomerase-like uncharacterized protein